MSNPRPEVFTPDNPPPFASWSSRFALQVRGTCCEPVIPDRAHCIFDQNEPYQVGDFVVIWALRASGVIKPMVKRLVLNVMPGARFPHVDDGTIDSVIPALVYETLTPPKMFQTDARAVWGIHRCVGYAPHSLIEIGGFVPHDDADVHWFDRPVLKKARRKRPLQTAAA